MNSDSFVLRKVEDGLPLTVFFPGWATDYRVFDSMDLPTNRLLPLFDVDGAGFQIPPQQSSLPPQRSFDELAAYIQANELAPVSLMGWSLGGFIAAEFARQFPELVSRLILCGVRVRYPAEQIEAARRGIVDDRERFLTSFYRQCFLPAQKRDFHRFRDGLMPCYLNDMSAEHLLMSLDYLARVEMNAGGLPDCPISMIHGAQDLVAPVHEAMTIAESASNVQLHIVPDAGHAVFLTGESTEIIQKCLE